MKKDINTFIRLTIILVAFLTISWDKDNKDTSDLYYSIIQEEVINRCEIKDFYVCKSTSIDYKDWFSEKIIGDTLLEKHFIPAGQDYLKNNLKETDLTNVIKNKYSLVDKSFIPQSKKPVISLSSVGLSKDKKYGIIYIDIVDNGLGGYGAFLYFKKTQDGHIEIITRKFTWRG